MLEVPGSLEHCSGARGCSGRRAPGTAPAPQKSKSNSIVSALRRSLAPKWKGRLRTAALPPWGTAEKTDPGVSRGLLATEASQQRRKRPPHPEPARLVCFMPFSKSTACQRAVKWFTPLQWGGVALKPQKPLGVLEGEVSRWCHRFPSQEPRWPAVQLSYTEQRALEEYFLFRHLSEQCHKQNNKQKTDLFMSSSRGPWPNMQN